MQNSPIKKVNHGEVQLRKPPIITAEEEKALRDQLHLEIENKTKACSFSKYDCGGQRLVGYEYCLKHILQDPRAPYKQCAYAYPITGKRCLQPAPKYESRRNVAFTNFCFEHSRLNQLSKTQATTGKLKHLETQESFLNELSHYVKTEPSQIPAQDTEVDVVTPCLDPFLEINSQEINERGRKILDYASDSSTDDDMPTISNTWRGYEMDNSDNESVDSQNEDLLKHASIYTTEEATMITKQKLIRLQSLYVDQFERLHHVLREKRRKYLHSLRRERETYCSIHNQSRDTPRERRLYRKLKALNQYHKKHGVEAVLHRKRLERRNKAIVGLAQKTPFHNRCTFTEGGVKCNERSIPCCKFCKKHILEDKKQVLFRACGVEKSGVVCQEAVPVIYDDATCVLHIDMPPARSYVLKKYESESEEDEPPAKVKTLEIKEEKSLAHPDDDVLPPVSSEASCSKMEVAQEVEIKEEFVAPTEEVPAIAKEEEIKMD
ncbi:KAT8 regulatory NSL complex subunit 2 isoform X2 [Phlebotomus papatasi]|uniref:KAT8 regulatory NSL complex subunit 2 isoform X2 n=1 Tax=Phlebotomus papatasi TaxID=29031 RepID=UPI0024846982|nr:KAT8 regulatory NSL complex subunit 2 isoform X2 [Phlebotomus papatasi]